MPKACEVRFVLFVVLFWDVFFPFFFFFWNNSVFLLPARHLFHLGTVQLALLVFLLAPTLGFLLLLLLLLAAAAGELISEMCQA